MKPGRMPPIFSFKQVCKKPLRLPVAYCCITECYLFLSSYTLLIARLQHMDTLYTESPSQSGCNSPGCFTVAISNTGTMETGASCRATQQTTYAANCCNSLSKLQGIPGCHNFLQVQLQELPREYGVVASALSEQIQVVFHQYAVRLQPNKCFHTIQSF